MTDNEIIKALERHGTKNPYAIGHHSGEFDIIADRFITLIEENKAQKAEVERRLHSIKLLEKDVADAQSELKEFKAMYVNKIAEMAIKKFAEKVKQEINYPFVPLGMIDDLVKEMVESEEE